MTLATTYAKRIVSTSTNYTCYLGPIEVGTADTYGQAERVCAEAYEDFQHIDPATLATLAKLTPTELRAVAEQVLAGLNDDALLPFEPAPADLTLFEKLAGLPTGELVAILQGATIEGYVSPEGIGRIDAIVQMLTGRTYGPQIDFPNEPEPPISTLPDGSIVVGHYDLDDSRCTAWVKTADGWGMNADQHGADVWHTGLGVNLEGMTPTKLHTLKAFVNSGAIEQMLACGVAWCAGEDIQLIAPTCQIAHKQAA